MGVSVIFLPMAIKRAQIGVKAGMMLTSILALLLVCLDGAVTIWDSVLLIALFLAFIAENVYSASKNREKSERPEITKKTVIVNILKFVLGAAALAIGSNLLVDNGKYLAKLMGVPERIIAITLIAIGTSLPELVTSISACKKGENDMAIGNVIGSNILNILCILGVS